MKISQLREGARSAFPIVLGYLPVGIAFGVLARKAGVNTLEAGMMSFVVYAGASQFIAVNMLASGAALLPIILTTFLVNLRHFLMSSALSTHFKKHSLPAMALIDAELTDESFAVAMAHPHRIDNRPGYLFGLQVTAQLSWIGGTVLGALFGPLIDAGSYGIPFALPALFICLLVLQFKGRVHFLVMGLAGVLSVLFKQLLPGNWYLVLAAVIAATAGLWLAGDNAKEGRQNEGVGPG